MYLHVYEKPFQNDLFLWKYSQKSAQIYVYVYIYTLVEILQKVCSIYVNVYTYISIHM